MEQILQPIGKAEPEFAALVAIDWADQKHYWSLQVVGQEGLQRGTLDNTPEAVEVWIMELHMRFGGRPLAVALEQRRGAWAVMLSKIRTRALGSRPPDDSGQIPPSLVSLAQ